MKYFETEAESPNTVPVIVNMNINVNLESQPRQPMNIWAVAVGCLITFTFTGKIFVRKLSSIVTQPFSQINFYIYRIY